MMIKVIIFDLWDTLGENGILLRLEDHLQIERTNDTKARFEKSTQLKKWDDIRDMAISYLQEMNISSDEEKINFVVKTFQEGIEKAVLFGGAGELLKSLSGNYKLAILSNTNNFESEVVKKWGIGAYFDTKIYSWQIGSLKPDKNNFMKIIEALGLRSDECVFVDDNIINTEAAKTFGFNSIRFQNLNQLKKELSSFSMFKDL